MAKAIHLLVGSLLCDDRGARRSGEKRPDPDWNLVNESVATSESEEVAATAVESFMVDSVTNGHQY